jgi:cytochrome c peroxidase
VSRETPDGSARDGGMTAEDALVPWKVEAFPAVPAPADNPVTDAKVALGRLLFYDPIVSVDRQTACATCHSEVWGMSDGLVRSVGHGGGLLSGPGRVGPNLERRNAPTLWNVAFKETAFWDGRAASLEDQVHFPIVSALELDRTMDEVVHDVTAIPGYLAAFQAAFPGEAEAVTAVTFARAIAAFERTLTSSRSLYDAYVAGDAHAMSESMLRGMRLFAREGCASCHRPPLFTSGRFDDRGVVAISGVPDEGRFEVTHDDADRNRFAVPSLRNLHETAPYFHTGGVAALDDAIKMEVARSVERDGAPPVGDDGIADLGAFLSEALFDSGRSPARPATVPSGLEVPIDGFALRR